MKKDCLFCRIASGAIPARVVEEDDNYLAFLTIYPNTHGCTVVIPREHAPSYFAEANPLIVTGLIGFSRQVALLLDGAFQDVGRTALVFEGYGVDHLHAKLFPMHGTPKPGEPWREIKSDINAWSDTYKGYISSHDCHKSSEGELDQVHKHILAHKLRSVDRLLARESGKTPT